jgi:hypothetical protein
MIMAKGRSFSVTKKIAQRVSGLMMVLMLVSSCSAIQPNISELSTPFKYRSISFGTPSRVGPPDAMGTSVTGERFKGIRLDMNRDMVRLAAEVGFNDVTIQTEKWTMPKLEALRKWADKTGNFKFIKDQGMTLSVWASRHSTMSGFGLSSASGTVMFAPSCCLKSITIF